MTARFNLNNVDAIEATASITMKISDWKKLYDELFKAKPMGVAYPLDDLITLSRQIFLMAMEKFEVESTL